MSISEYSKMNGHRLELKKELQSLEYRAENHIITINETIDPLFDFTDIEIERAYEAMKSLKIIINKAKEVQEKIEKINNKIGHE